MKAFITSLFSDSDGCISSKRLIMFALIAVFITACYVNLFTGKMLDASLLSSLVTLIITIFTLVFGEKVTDVFKNSK